MSEKITCPGCGKPLAPTTSGRYRKHGGGECDFSGTVIQEEEWDVKSSNASSVKSPQGDATENAELATCSTPSPPGGQEPEDDASTSANASPAIPGVESYTNTLGEIQAEQAAEYKARVDANLKTEFSQPTPPDYERPTLFSQPVGPVTWEPPEGAVAKPAPPAFSQPAGRRSEAPPLPMTAEAGELAARLKELFYAYDNRRSSDNRSAQVTMGPSEMGTPCDRRLALSLMRMPPVNPGGDGWAAFVGTAIHAALEQMFMWADAGTGRFAVEQRLEFPSAYVPKGTADLIDRTLFMLDDHKCQGRWSRNKLRTQGPSPTYRAQAHTYAYGARLRGERIEKIAIISWPRDEATLDDLYVHVEDYSPAIVKAAFERVEEIGASVGANIKDLRRLYEVPEGAETSTDIKARVAANYNVADDCRFCPFYLPNARDITRGCNGKR